MELCDGFAVDLNNIIMPNIKISFEHPFYLYPFRVSLNSSMTGSDI